MRLNNGLPILATLVFALIFTSCGNLNARKAVKVNDAIINDHRELMGKLGSFIEALESKDANEIDRSLTGLKSAADNGLSTAASQEAIKCNSTFVPAAEEMFRFYVQAAEEEYSMIAELYSRDSISYGEFDSLQLIIKQIEDEQEETDEAFLAAQQDFARSCGFKLVRNVE